MTVEKRVKTGVRLPASAKIEARVQWEASKRLGMNLDDAPPADVDAKQIEKDFGIEGPANLRSAEHAGEL